jgi:recombination protein RecA
LDKILGGGIPCGTLTQIYGLEGGGKTTLAYHIVGEGIKNGYETVFIALEGYSKPYARACGVDVDSELFSVVAMEFAETAFNLTLELVRQSPAKVFVMDSIKGVVSKSVMDKKLPTDDLDKGPTIGVSARTIGEFIRRIKLPINRKEVVFVVVNQLTTEIGFISRQVPSGGIQLQYFTDLKLNLYGKKDRTKQELTTTITVDKCKEWAVTPFGSTIIKIRHGEGIDRDEDLLRVCRVAGIVKKAGTWFNYKDKKWQGSESFCAAMSDLDLRNELYKQAYEASVAITNKEIEEDDGTE